MSLRDKLDHEYLKLHVAREDAFWSTRMALKSSDPGELETKEKTFKTFIADASHLGDIRKALEQAGLSEEERLCLKGWQRFFEANALESQEAKQHQSNIIELESRLESARTEMELGYQDPQSNEFIKASSVQLSLMVATSNEEPLRKAAWKGLRSIESFVLEKGFIEVVKARNAIARSQGYSDFYDYKSQISEGMSKAQIFSYLDELEVSTRESCKAALEKLATKHGESVKQGWNLNYFISGDLTKKIDPYFPFENALHIWGKSFAAMGVDYQGASLTLDLLDRKSKYENGFMHGPDPCFTVNGKLKPARINFTANALPGQIGSGLRALVTLFHEGGHAAHFSNIRMPSPCFSMEYPPTSAAFAETQSMFLDSIIGDTDWRMRYAKNSQGKTIPAELIKETLENRHRNLVFSLRTMLAVCYAEKAIYEIADNDLTAEKILSTLREAESKLLQIPDSPRPILSIPHLLNFESSAYYHSYVLAEMAVNQTRDYFKKRDGHLVDNPNIGKDLARTYWSPGNSESFLELIKKLTSEDFSVAPTVALVNHSLEDVLRESEEDAKNEEVISQFSGEIKLNANIRVIHGDEIIAEAKADEDFNQLADKFKNWILNFRN